MKMAYLVRERSTCLRRAVGAVVVKDNRILSTGYNGAPKGLRHCEDVGCIRVERNIPSGERHELCRGVHAEQNAVIQAAVFGVSIKDATMYGTNHPCSVCARILVNADIKEIVYSEGYADDLAKAIIEESGIEVRQFHLKLDE
jgi:dCMP deaminase